DLVERVADALGDGLVGRDGGAELLLLALLLREVARVLEGDELAAQPLAGVLDARELAVGLIPERLALGGEDVELDLAPAGEVHPRGGEGVAKRAEVLDGEGALRARGVAGDEDGLVVGHALEGELEVVRGFRGLAVFVETQEGDVEAVPRELEVVDVA